MGVDEEIYVPDLLLTRLFSAALFPLILLCLYLLHGTLNPHVPFWAASLLIFGLVVFIGEAVREAFDPKEYSRLR